MSNISVFSTHTPNIKTCRMCNVCGRELTEGTEQGLMLRYKCSNNGVMVIMCDECLKNLQTKLILFNAQKASEKGKRKNDD